MTDPNAFDSNAILRRASPHAQHNSAILEYWMYASKSQMHAEQSDGVIQQIVETSRRNNDLKDVTGVLIFTGTFFAQYLEGSPDAILALRHNISADARHGDIRTLGSGPIGERRFGDWCLAYSSASPPFDRLVSLAFSRQGLTGRILLLEMMRRFKSLA